MMQRYDPYRRMTSMQRLMDRMMDDSYLIPALVSTSRGGESGESMLHRIDLDVMEQGDDLVIKASMPGVKPEDIHVTVEKGVLTIRGEVHEEHEHGEGRYRHRERHHGSFRRSVLLPDEVNPEACQADIEHGVLTLTFPKASHARAHRIPIRATGRRTVDGGTGDNRQMMSGAGADTGRGEASSANPEGSITRP